MNSLRALLRPAMLILLLLNAGSPARAQPTEQTVKAAFLPKFARYVTWPATARPTAGEPLVLCVIGRDSLGPLLDRAAAGQSLGQNPLLVRRLTTPDQAASCHMAFVKGRTPQATAAMLSAIKSQPILTVTDGAAEVGRGIIHFTVHQGRVRFYIDEATAARCNLAIDSRLLSIALAVKQRPS